MSARDVMAKAILNAGMNMGALAHRTADTFEGKIVDFQIEALTAAGYTLIRDDENHKATVERCIAVAEAEPEMPGSPPETVLKAMIEAGPIENARASCRATKRGVASALRSLIKEDGDAK